METNTTPAPVPTISVVDMLYDTIGYYRAHPEVGGAGYASRAKDALRLFTARVERIPNVEAPRAAAAAANTAPEADKAAKAARETQKTRKKGDAAADALAYAIGQISAAGAAKDSSDSESATDPHTRLLNALRGCAAVAPGVEKEIGLLARNNLTWAKRYRVGYWVRTFALFVIGVGLLWRTDSQRKRVLLAEIRDQKMVIATSVAEAGLMLERSRLVIDGLYDRRPSHKSGKAGGSAPSTAAELASAQRLVDAAPGTPATLTKQAAEQAPKPIVPTDSVQRTLFNQLSAANALVGGAIHALDRLAELMDVSRADSAFAGTVMLQKARGFQQVANAAEKRFADRMFAAPTAGKDIQPAWRSVVEDYYNALDSTRRATAQVEITPELQKFSASPWMRNAFSGRSQWDFVVKLAYAVAYVLIGGVVIVLLAQAFGLSEGKEPIGKLLEGSATRGMHGVMAFWPVIAPLGLAAGLAGGYAMTPTVKPPPPVVIHEPAGDSALFKRVDAALSRMQTDLDSLKKVTDTIQARAR